MKKNLLTILILILTFSFAKTYAGEIPNPIVSRTIWQLKKELDAKQKRGKTLKTKNHYRRLSLNVLYIEKILKDYYRTMYLLDKITDSNYKKSMCINSQAFDNFGKVKPGYENRKYVKVKGEPRFAKRGPRWGLGTTFDGKKVRGLKGSGWSNATGWEKIK